MKWNSSNIVAIEIVFPNPEKAFISFETVVSYLFIFTLRKMLEEEAITEILLQEKTH